MAEALDDLLRTLRASGIREKAMADNLESENRVPDETIERFERALEASNGAAVSARLGSACNECCYALPVADSDKEHVESTPTWFAYMEYSKLEPYLSGAIPEGSNARPPPRPSLRGTSYKGRTGRRLCLWITTYNEKTNADRARTDLGLEFVRPNQWLYRVRFAAPQVGSHFTPTAFDAQAAPFWAKPSTMSGPFGRTRSLDDFSEVALELLVEPMVPQEAERVGLVETAAPQGYLSIRQTQVSITATGLPESAAAPSEHGGFGTYASTSEVAVVIGRRSDQGGDR